MSALETTNISSNSRAARFDLFRRRWLLPWRVRISLPPPLYFMRRAAPLWVLSLGIVSVPLPDRIGQERFGRGWRGRTAVRRGFAPRQGIVADRSRRPATVV